MIDISNDELLTLSAAARHCPRYRLGRKPHVATLRRWSTRGCRDVVLETIETPGGRCTTVAALQRFFNHLSAARNTASLRSLSTEDDGQHEVIETELQRRFQI